MRVLIAKLIVSRLLTFQARGCHALSLRKLITDIDSSSSAFPSVHGSTEDPCNADIILGFHGGVGFGSKMNNFMNQLAFSVHEKKSVAFSAFFSGKFFETWTSFFDNSLPICQSEARKYNASIEPELRQFFNSLAVKDPKYVTDLKRSVYGAHYRYSKETQDHIDQTLRRAGLPAKFFGVHIRHGDKVKEAEPVSTENYGKAIIMPRGKETTEENKVKVEFTGAMAHMRAKQAAEHILTHKDKSIRTVWLATLDKQAADILRETLGGEYEVKHLNQTASDWQGARDSEAEQYFPGSSSMYDMLTDVEALRRSHTFIGTASSNLGRLVYFLRESSSNAISLDEDFLKRSG